MNLKQYIDKYDLTTKENWLAFIEESEDELFYVVQRLVAAKDLKIAGWLIQKRIEMFGYFQI